MEAEHLGPPPGVLQPAAGQPREAGRGERALQQLQVGQVGLGVRDSRPRRGPCAASRRAAMKRSFSRQRSSVAQRGAPPRGAPGSAPGRRRSRPPARPRSAGGSPSDEAESWRSSTRTSAAWRPSASARCRSSAVRVTSAVTKGLPSRSPPIQVPKRRKGGTRNGTPGHSAARAREQRTVDGRHGVEQRPLEDQQAGADLVERGGAGRAATCGWRPAPSPPRAAAPPAPPARPPRPAGRRAPPAAARPGRAGRARSAGGPRSGGQ